MNAELTFLNALQALRTPALDGVMRFFTHLGDSGFVWLALTALLLAFRRTRRAGWVLAAALLFDAVLCNILLKPMVGRIRPCHKLQPHCYVKGRLLPVPPSETLLQSSYPYRTLLLIS